MATQTFTLDANDQDGYRGGSYFETGNSLIGSTDVTGYWRLKIATTIPQGSTINSATFAIKSNNSRSGAALVTYFAFEDSDNPATPTSAANLTGRTYQSTTTGFSQDSWAGEDAVSKDLTASLQQIVDNRELTAGEYVLLANHWVSGSLFWLFYNRETDAAKAGKLDVDWTEVAAGNRRRRSIICGA